MSMQDTASGVALWRQVADGIERGIADGRFAAGEKLPGEMEIAETYRVNRHTVRRALATLAERGLVRAERGSGTYVEAPAPRLSAALADAVLRNRRRRRPRAARPVDRRDSEEVATRELARELGLKTGAPLIRIESVRLADRTPICVSTTWLSAERFPDAGRGLRQRALDDQAAGALRHPRLSPCVDPDHRRHRRRDRCRAARSRARTSGARGRQHRRRYRRQAAGDQALALCRRARRVSGGEWLYA